MSRCFAIALVVLLASVLSSEVPSAVEAKEQESAGGSSVVTEQQRESIVQTIEQLVTDINESSSRRDVDRFYSFFSDQTTAVINDRMVLSWDEHKQQGRTFFNSLSKAEYVADDIHVDVLTPDVAVYMGRHRFSGEDKSGKSISATFVQTWVFRRHNGTWRIVHAHLSEGIGNYDPYENRAQK